MLYFPQTRVAELTNLFADLLAAEPRTVQDFAKLGSTVHGIYVISDLDENIVYVGRTRDGSNGLRGRANQHLNCNESSDLKHMLCGNRELAKQHLIRVVEIQDLDKRRFAEYFGIAVLQPKLNK